MPLADYKTVTTKTAQNLAKVATSLNLEAISRLSLPGIEAVANLGGRQSFRPAMCPV